MIDDGSSCADPNGSLIDEMLNGAPIPLARPSPAQRPPITLGRPDDAETFCSRLCGSVSTAKFDFLPPRAINLNHCAAMKSARFRRVHLPSAPFSKMKFNIRLAVMKMPLGISLELMMASL